MKVKKQVYLSPDNADWLDKQESASGVVNELITSARVSPSRILLTELLNLADAMLNNPEIEENKQWSTLFAALYNYAHDKLRDGD